MTAKPRSDRAGWGSRKGWVPVTLKVPPELAKALARGASHAGLNRSEYLYRLLAEVLPRKADRY